MICTHRFNINPVPASRPRVSRWSTYYPKSNNKFKKEMEDLKSGLEKNPSEKLVSVELKFGIMIPKSWSKKKREELNNTYCSNNSDIDNYIKAILDSLNGIVYIDDKQVVELFAKKIYSEEGYILYKHKEIYGNIEGRTM